MKRNYTQRHLRPSKHPDTLLKANIHILHIKE